MYQDGAGCTVLVSRVTWYNCALVDLSRSRSVHALEHEPCCPDPSKLSSSECHAVHYGLCSPLLKLPPFSLPPAVTRPNDPWDVLVSEIEDQLRDVVSNFVQTDKIRKETQKTTPKQHAVTRDKEYFNENHIKSDRSTPLNSVTWNSNCIDYKPSKIRVSSKEDKIDRNHQNPTEPNGDLYRRIVPQVPERTTSSKFQGLEKSNSCDTRKSNVTTIPHPKLTSVQKQHIRERSPVERHGHNLVSKGSVAERVLQFERCPDLALERTATKIKPALLVNKQEQHKSQSLYNYKDKENVQLHLSSLYQLPPDITSCSINIPRFYFPHGHPKSTYAIDEQLRKITATFLNFPERKVLREQFGIIAKACGLPLYWKIPLFLAAGGEKTGFVCCDTFLDSWKRIINICYDEPSQFICILSCGSRNYLLPEDFIPMMQDIIDTHPGLTFLKEATEFHSRYIQTVIARIYYCVNRSWSGRITAPELRKSDYLQVVALLEEEEDINLITEYFSYEHFYVIYCKFWELDTDHDLTIDKNDLSRHNDGAISSRMIDRIFSGAVTRGSIKNKGKMNYSEFVWFLISEEDKRHPRSIEYWFRCMDLDGDGFLSMYELEYFYDEQLQRMEALGIETLPFKDCLCQMLDMVRPKYPGKISLSDLKHCKMTPVFFDTFFNLEKFLDHEQRDPFASQRDQTDGIEMSDWDIYAAEEYEILIAEEGLGLQSDHYSLDEADQELDEYSQSLGKFNLSAILHSRSKNFMDIDDEDYDYAESDAEYPY
ncbi:serine/threonine-protein phosphatase 2A regulatory subunit B'' subunit beta-like isoform X1 [Centruroides sculpturatus]|uniref:serine/threonine-protein phosphatase 2A regulatory subunit B'' subunit beta-like isoform X1 n=1 Tax=Centruroides sculpturatus TaxID=218467 RepID=UPI000C6E02F7|nr:serine/threonine-protein phosphatase 2A regulatory subunit B'' subunit beta-like isoform X1 [Centruroides sculpturatus]